MDGDDRPDLVLTTGRDKLSVLLNIGPTSFSFAGDKMTLGWPPVRDALGYNVYREATSLLVDGDGDGLPDAGYGTCQAATDLDAAANQIIDPTLPNTGDGFFYLRSVVDQDGERDLGSTSEGLPRVPAEICP